MKSSILDRQPLGFPWVTVDPFLFCVHHDDAYPAGNEFMGPDVSLSGRRLGEDFVVKDGFRMYHGHVVPGFPQHPHRGFETVTLVRRGLIDHSDSLGATARFGEGDAQWLTAGEGIVHAEMFPLVHRDKPNPLELFQIWLNLPSKDKFAPPHFAMLWNKTIPRHELVDARGLTTHVTTVCGVLPGANPRLPPPPPPRSWAASSANDVAIWTVRMDPGATWTLPRARYSDTRRTLYFFRGTALTIQGEVMTTHGAYTLRSDEDIALEAGPSGCEMLMLQGRPIGEPVAQHGPFVMNRQQEIVQAIADYRRTRFGGWPWPKDDPVHGRSDGRFAKHADGRTERAEHAGREEAI